MNPITLPVAELKPALIGLGKIISRRTTLPVLGHVLVERNPDGWVTLAATDLDNTARVRLEQPGDGGPASLLVPFAELQKTVKSCTNGENITLETSGKQQVTLRYPIGSQFAEQKVESLPVEDFPPLPEIGGTPVPLCSDVRQAIMQAMECASTDETRVILNGAYLDLSDRNCQQIVATDGRHLYSSNSFSLLLKDSLLIPDHKFLGWREFGNDGEWELRVQPTPKDGPGMLQISSRRWSFIGRQIEGNYPNWRQVVPAPGQYSTTVSLPQASMDSILALIAKIPCHDAINQTIGLRVEGRKLSIRGRSAGDSKWTDLEIDGTEVKGSPVSIYLNRVFLSKALKFGLCQIDIIDPLTPLRFSNGGRQMIVMPIRADNPPPASPAIDKQPQPPEPGEAKPADSETHQPAPNGANTERGTMPKTTADTTANGTGGTNGHDHAEPKPALETALAQIDTIKTGFREAIADLNKLTDLLKQAAREQKAGDREVQSVRQTLRSLQSVRI
jgi:DNA polymerase III sliding clamp (beta) subunit (PCNA family)